MNLFFLVDDINNSDLLYLGRLLILLKVFSGQRGNQTVDTFSKLAQLDFLMSNPVYLERALSYRNQDRKNQNNIDIKLEDYERYSIDAKTTHYRYRPWEIKYRILVQLLEAKNLALICLEGNTIKLKLTEKGISIAELLAELDTYSKENIRAKMLYREFKVNSNNLTKFMYEKFPELSTLADKEVAKDEI
jgi:hypothetical protein